VKRNDPCWCGSGKKYKKCHMDSERGDALPAVSPLVKGPRDVAGMRRAGAFNGELMDYVRSMVRPGITTDEIDARVHERTVRAGHVPATLGYRGYPRSCCTSINEVVCHGIPSRDRVLRAGDIVNVDLTTIVDGCYGDSSETFYVGEVTSEARRLVEATARALVRGIGAVSPGRRLQAVAQAIEPFVNAQGYSVVRDYTGHGIGRQFHERYSVCHHVTVATDDLVMEPGMTFTIEPMVNAGGWAVVLDGSDGWTVRTADGKLTAQFEHTILVTESGAEVLTLTPSQRSAGALLLLDGVPVLP
jgi:methionyl aminopeptidase